MNTSHEPVLLLNRLQRSWWSRLFAILTSICLSVPHVGLIPLLSANQPPPETSEIQQTMDRMYAAAEAAIGQIDRSGLELSKAAETAGDSPEAIRDWINRRVSWVPYIGLLRGAEGTLHSGEGNSLDRALLLADLMKRRGFEVEIVHAKVPVSLRKPLETRLLSSGKGSWLNVPDSLSHWDPEAWASVMGSSASEVEVEKERHRQESTAWRHQLNAEVASQAGKLLAKLESEQVRSPQRNSHVEAALADHFWVRYRSPSDPNTRDLCLAYGDSIPQALLQKPEASYASTTDFPEPMVHTITFRFIIEQVQGEKTNPATVFEYQAPAWQLGNRQVEMAVNGKHAHSTSEAIREAFTDPEAYAAAAFQSVINESEWVPFLKVEGSEEPFADKQFNASGELAERTGDMISTGAALGRAMGLFGALGAGSSASESSPTVLSMAALQIETYSPDTGKRTEIRELFRIDPSEIDNGKLTQAASERRALALAQYRTFMVQVGRLPEHWAVWKQLSALLKTRLSVNYLLRNANKPSDEMAEAFEKVSARMDSFNGVLATTACLRSVSPSTYIHSPNIFGLVAHSLPDASAIPQGTIAAGFDWIQNPVASRSTDATNRFKEVVTAGVYDTVLEHHIIRATTGSTVTDSVSHYWSEADDTSSWVLADSGFDTKHSESTRGIRSDHNSGFLVWANQDTGGDQWWRIHPETGETLGMARTELGVAGAAFTEYQIKLGLIALNAIKCLGGYYSCASGGKGFGCYLCHWIGAAAAILSLGFSTQVGYVLSGIDGVSGTFCNIFG